MKLLIAGPLHTDFEANDLTRQVIDSFENSTVDVGLMPSSFSVPVSHYTASLLQKELRAPFDVSLFVHSADRMRLDYVARKHSAVCIAYVTHASTLGRGLPDRMKHFDWIVPADQESYDRLLPWIEPWEGVARLTDPASPTDLAAFLMTVPAVVNETQTVPTEDAAWAFTDWSHGASFDPLTVDASITQIENWAERINPFPKKDRVRVDPEGKYKVRGS